MKIVVYNLGCKVNKYECDSLMKKLREKGYEVSENLEIADIYILNTCAVTNEAERKSRQCVERCLKFNNNAKIYICGCASEHNAIQFKEKNNVEYVIGTANKMKLVDSFENKGINVENISNIYEDDFSPTIDRTRAFVKIQDGCNNFCSYCLIPYVRGRSRSRSIESITKECHDMSQLTKEIVLTGIDISSYGKDINTNLSELLMQLKNIKCRIRLGSLELNIINDNFLKSTKQLFAFCPQFHLSMQSGDDEILKKMNRHYTTNDYLEKVNLIRSYYPDAGITTDLICGFPTETDQSFENTLNFIRLIKFSQIHIFPYSKREGTIASKMTQIPNYIKKMRCKKAQEIANLTKQEYLEKMLNKELEVLIEDKEDDYMVGYSREYIKIKIKNAVPNTILKVVGYNIENGAIVAK